MACVELGRALAAELDPQRLLEVFLQQAGRLMPADNWSLLLVDEEREELYFAASPDLDLAQVAGVRLKPGQGIAGQVWAGCRSITVENVRDSPYFNPAVDRLTGFVTEAIIAAPLVFQGRVLGVIEAVNPRDLKPPAQAVVSVIADFAAVAVENTRRLLRIHDLTVRDNLTGLYNTRHLYRALEDLLARRPPQVFSLVFMDMDGFKSVVDTYGHLNGSRALQQVAQTLRQCLPAPGFGVAYGGDEFVLVLPGLGKAEATAVVEAVRTAMAATTYLQDQGLAVKLSASFGQATCPEDAADLTGILALADAAMFRAKGRGKGCLVVEG
ncbi:MAG: sensor domain-containing diguanylate cyclase [Thermodesulfobacteriota bacterium]